MRSTRGFAVFTGILLIAAAQSTGAASSPCEKLMRDFVQNEVAYSLVFDLHRDVRSASEQYAQTTGDWSKLAAERREHSASEEEFKAQGDKLTGLLAARRCPLPDHVASPNTFRRDMNACTTAKGTSGEQEACDFIERAVRRSMKAAFEPPRRNRLSRATDK